jgi:hypothetical protein
MVPVAPTSGEHNTVVLVAHIIRIWETVVHQQQMLLKTMAWISFIRELLLGRHNSDCRHSKERKKTKYAVKGKRKK